MRRLLCIGALVLVGCEAPSEPAPQNGPVSLPSTPRPSQPAGERPKPAEPCADAPAWAHLTGQCVADGHVYGVGVARTIRNGGLAYHGASDRARGALSTESVAEIERSEILDTHRCGQEVWALARRPSRNAERVPSCTVDMATRGPTENECPEWMGSLGYFDGESVVGVGIVDGINNPTMAERVARTRAAMEQQKSFRIRVTVGSDGTLGAATTSRVTTVTEESELGRCGSMTLVRVKSRVFNP